MIWGGEQSRLPKTLYHSHAGREAGVLHSQSRILRTWLSQEPRFLGQTGTL